MDEGGYIYVYKCILGTGSNACKIGKTKNLAKRLQQHVRTPYYGFMPYLDFLTGKAIATGFKIKNYQQADKIIHNIFHDYQFGNYEIYNIDYDKCIEELYNNLSKNKILIDFIKDGCSPYIFLEKKIIKKEDFERLLDKIKTKYPNNIFPEELINMLRDKTDFITNCKSHYDTGNYIDFPNDMILDLNFSKSKRNEIKSRLELILNEK